MAEDQHTPQDPTTQYGQRQGQPSQQQAPPGSSGEMTPEPDHGERSYQGSGKLAGRRALITGADSGIGRAVALAFAREGADVLVSYLQEHEDAQETARLVREAGQRAVLVAGDIVNFTKGLAADLAEQGIRVNSVAPGPVWTPLIPATMPPEKVRSFGGNTPLGRPAQPAELAPAYVFFASQESSFVTGEVLGVTGGRPIT